MAEVGESEVGTVSATDPDDDISGYGLSGMGAENFEIDDTGKISVIQMLDYETQTTYQLEVSVDDSNGNSDTASLTINVTDVDEDPVFVRRQVGGLGHSASRR